MRTTTSKVYLTIFFAICIFCQTTFSQTLYDMGLGYRRAMNSDWIGSNASNVIRDSIGLSNPYLVSKLPALNPMNLRYPAGGTANWWNWRTGWFVDRDDLPNGYETLTPKADRLEDLKPLLDETGANALLIVNMLTSTLQEQIAFLKHADSIGIPVKLVELGSEFYLEGGDDSIAILAMYPTPESYADTASRWCDTIHHYFPNAKIAAQGAFNRNNAYRRKIWDEHVFPTLHGEDAISYHTYMSANNFDEDASGTYTFTASDVPVLLGRPFKMWSTLYTEDFPLVPAGKDIWVTEFNLRDHNRPVHGCWAHGLFLATQVMQYLNDGRIKHLANHDIAGNSLAGSFFYNTKGYNLGNSGNFVAPDNAPAHTQYWGLTSGGRAMQQLGLAVQNASYASPLDFKNIPIVTVYDGNDTLHYPSVYGWVFLNNGSAQALIVNLTGTDIKVRTNYIFPSGGSYERYYADPMLFEAYESDISYASSNSLPTQLLIKAYSMTRISGASSPAAPPSVNITSNGGTSFCIGDSVLLDAGSGYLEYLWSTGATTQTVWAKTNGDYWVHVRSTAYGYYGADTVTLNVYSFPQKPSIKVVGSAKICIGSSTSLVSNRPYFSYLWSTGATTSSINVSTAGSYTLTVSDDHGCSASSNPKIVAYYNPPSTFLTNTGGKNYCQGSNITLYAKVVSGYTYQWQKNAVNISGATKSNYSVSSGGSYDYVATDSHGCTRTSNVMTITTNCRQNDGISDEQTDVNSFTLYPNPATNAVHTEITFNEPGNHNFVLEIRNMLGVLMEKRNYVSESELWSDDIELNDNYTDGVYFIIIRTNDAVLRKQVVVQRN